MLSKTIPPPHVIVLGAGVIGLQTAISLQEQGINITIVATDWPGTDNSAYTSMWAGAQWRSTSKMDELRTQGWEWETFAHWLDLLKKVPSEESGLETQPAIYYWDYAAPKTIPPESWIWWTTFIPSYQLLPRTSIPASGPHAAGISYESFNLWPQKYLQYLLSEAVKAGAKTLTCNIISIPEAFSLPELGDAGGLINCTGIGAGSLAHDPALFPTKGQSVIVRGQASKISTGLGDGWEAVVVPRPGIDETFLGVSKVANDWSLEVDDETTKSILDRCKPIAPELLNAQGEFDVLSVQVGLRPTRHGGPRVEIESLERYDKTPSEAGKFLCHNYGHHGAGFEDSYGSAKTVVELVIGELEKHVSFGA